MKVEERTTVMGKIMGISREVGGSGGVEFPLGTIVLRMLIFLIDTSSS